MKWEDISFQRTRCCLFSWWYMVLKTPLMFVKSIDDCDKHPSSFLWHWPFWCLENKTSFSASVAVNSRLCISPVCFFLFVFQTVAIIQRWTSIVMDIWDFTICLHKYMMKKVCIQSSLSFWRAQYTHANQFRVPSTRCSEASWEEREPNGCHYGIFVIH